MMSLALLFYLCWVMQGMSTLKGYEARAMIVSLVLVLGGVALLVWDVLGSVPTYERWLGGWELGSTIHEAYTTWEVRLPAVCEGCGISEFPGYYEHDREGGVLPFFLQILFGAYHLRTFYLRFGSRGDVEMEAWGLQVGFRSGG